jgi:hypothetical protein
VYLRIGRFLVEVLQQNQAETDIMLLACFADTRGARIVEAGEGVVRGVELDVDVADIVSCRPCDGLLEPETAPASIPILSRNLIPGSPFGSEPVFPKSAPHASLFPPAFFSPAHGKRPLTRRTRRC